MPRDDFLEKHQVMFVRSSADGSSTSYNLETSLPRKVVIEAEAGNVSQQQEVIVAFEKRFRRRFRNESLPKNITWSDFQHPIIPTTQARP